MRRNNIGARQICKDVETNVRRQVIGGRAGVQEESIVYRRGESGTLWGFLSMEKLVNILSKGNSLFKCIKMGKCTSQCFVVSYSQNLNDSKLKYQFSSFHVCGLTVVHIISTGFGMSNHTNMLHYLYKAQKCYLSHKSHRQVEHQQSREICFLHTSGCVASFKQREWCSNSYNREERKNLQQFQLSWMGKVINVQTEKLQFVNRRNNLLSGPKTAFTTVVLRCP